MELHDKGLDNISNEGNHTYTAEDIQVLRDRVVYFRSKAQLYETVEDYDTSELCHRLALITINKLKVMEVKCY